MKTEKEVKKLSVIFSACIIFLIISCTFTVSGLGELPAAVDYQGQWYSRGFSSFFIWKTFVFACV